MSNTTKSVKEKMAQLDEYVAWFEGDEFELEKAVDTFKNAEELAKEIESDLATIKNDIVILKESFDKS
jgi:exodeoxyribonuclease VII small subunit